MTQSTLVAELKQAWLSERFAPELLPYCAEVVANVQAELQIKEAFIERQFSDPEDQFVANLYEMEVERIKYMLAQYLKARLTKIETYFNYLLRHNHTRDLMSPEELSYASSYSDLIGQHAQNSFLGQLPERLQSLSDTSGSASMIVEPKHSKHVFFRALADVGDVAVAEVTIDVKKNDIYMVRYEAVQQLLSKKQIELI